MRKLTDHIVQGDSVNHQLEIHVEDAPGSGGANHQYMIWWTATNPVGDKFKTPLEILFQNGPIKEVGVNGVTHEALLAIIIDRLSAFQKGPFASEYNERALHHARLCLNEMQSRTRERMVRGVEGTQQK